MTTQRNMKTIKKKGFKNNAVLMHEGVEERVAGQALRKRTED